MTSVRNATIETRTIAGRRTRRWSGLGRRLGCVLLVCATAFLSLRSIADDVAGLSRQLTSATDFRVRVGAALSLGKVHQPGAFHALVAALDDPHPAVRAAAAAALGALGDTRALAFLRRRISAERSSPVKAQLRAVIAKLDERGDSAGSRGPTRMLVKLGEMRNASGVRGAELAELLRGTTRKRAADIPGVKLVTEDGDERRIAGGKKLPCVMLDGVVNRLERMPRGADIAIAAQVEYVVRKLPDHALKGSATGSAQAVTSAAAVKDGARLAELEDEVVAGAVDSAMRGAVDVMAQAAR